MNKKEKKLRKKFENFDLGKIFDTLTEVGTIFHKKQLTPLEVGIVTQFLDDARRDHSFSIFMKEIMKEIAPEYKKDFKPGDWSHIYG